MLRSLDNSLGLLYTCVSCDTMAKQSCLFLPHHAYAGVVSKRVNGSGWCSPQRLPSGIPILYCIIRRFRYLKNKRVGLLPLVPYQVACTPTITLPIVRLFRSTTARTVLLIFLMTVLHV